MGRWLLGPVFGCDGWEDGYSQFKRNFIGCDKENGIQFLK
jgi:hypothetical protein